MKKGPSFPVAPPPQLPPPTLAPALAWTDFKGCFLERISSPRVGSIARDKPMWAQRVEVTPLSRSGPFRRASLAAICQSALQLL